MLVRMSILKCLLRTAFLYNFVNVILLHHLLYLSKGCWLLWMAGVYHVDTWHLRLDTEDTHEVGFRQESTHVKVRERVCFHF